MTREPIEVTRQDRIYCLKASSDYHSEVCEECRFYPNCDHMTQDDLTELTIKDLEALEQEPKTGHWILAGIQSEEDIDNDNYRYICSECQHSDIHAKDIEVPYCWNCGAKMEGEEKE